MIIFDQESGVMESGGIIRTGGGVMISGGVFSAAPQPAEEEPQELLALAGSDEELAGDDELSAGSQILT